MNKSSFGPFVDVLVLLLNLIWVLQSTLLLFLTHLILEADFLFYKCTFPLFSWWIIQRRNSWLKMTCDLERLTSKAFKSAPCRADIHNESVIFFFHSAAICFLHWVLNEVCQEHFQVKLEGKQGNTHWLLKIYCGYILPYQATFLVF